MSRIPSRPVRVIASSTRTHLRVRHTRNNDFAALLRRTGAFPPATEKQSIDTDLAFGQDNAEQLAADVDYSLDRRIGNASQRIVTAVLRREQQILELAYTIARDITEFAANPAIRQSGHWEVTLRVDPQRLPGTQLHLTLSPATLLLRFEVETADIRELLLLHAGLLERELRKLLARQAEPRVLELTVH
ncbi:type III secretion system protein SctP [Burkholderia metallica]|uniref:type III secretion system protein SctP n=1 Tax=Burkholderia metallica TaxID=488729 RepID=UPI001CF2C20B|nr:type III secretion system protein SctP [Burkholderia metallica]MCA8002729.1 type III secretion system protein SctP [Burkholderia metallica]